MKDKEEKLLEEKQNIKLMIPMSENTCVVYFTVFYALFSFKMLIYKTKLSNDPKFLH